MGYTSHQFEHVKSIMTLRSGKVVEKPNLKGNPSLVSKPTLPPKDQPPTIEVESQEDPPIEEPHPPPKSPKLDDLGFPIDDFVTNPFTPRASFQGALRKTYSPHKNDTEIQEMTDIFKQVHINIPLLDTIKKVSPYAKFLKNLCTQKRKNRATQPYKVHLNEKVSSIITRPIPNLKDPVTQTINCVIGHHTIDRSLIELGDNLNIIFGELFDQFVLGGLQPSWVTIAFTDQSIKSPRGMIENVLVKVEDFYFPVNFLVLDMETTFNSNCPPLILGHPFLNMANASINCRMGAMDISFGNKKLRLNIFNSNRPNICCLSMDTITSPHSNLLEGNINHEPPNPFSLEAHDEDIRMLEQLSGCIIDDLPHLTLEEESNLDSILASFDVKSSSPMPTPYHPLVAPCIDSSPLDISPPPLDPPIHDFTFGTI